MTQEDKENKKPNRRTDEERRRFLKQIGGTGTALSFGASASGAASTGESTPRATAPERGVGQAEAVAPADVPRADESDRDTDGTVPYMLPFSRAEYRRIQRRIESGDFPQPPASDVQRVPDEGGEQR